MRSSALAVFVMAFVAACSGPEAPEPAPVVGDDAISIVNGDRERGHPAVGAMTFQFQGQYFGSFCSGTLIADRWVLTAAHCTEGLREQGLDPTPNIIYFYIGDDARPVGRGARPEGEFYQAANIFLHPGYTGTDFVGLYDIALIELREAPDIDPYPALDSGAAQFVGDDVFYVGFGVNDGNRQTGGGIKRSVTLTLGALYNTMYRTDHDNNGVCFGDSGGPGLVQVGGQWRVIGVNSSVSGEPICRNASLQTRVDAYMSWIRETMGDNAACQAGGDEECFCEAACGNDGVCDNADCGDRCSTIAACTNRCRDADCFTDCLLDGTANGVRLFGNFYGCVTTNCNNARTVDEYNRCIDANCADENQACQDEVIVDPPDDLLTCEGLLECLQPCQDDECALDCFNGTSGAGQAEYNALAECAQGCGPGTPEYDDCMRAQCSGVWLTCIPSDGCDVTGGNCPPGNACLPHPWGGTYCTESGDGQLGDVCDPEQLSCEDGAYCIDDGEGGDPTCLQVCTENNQCPERECFLFEGAGEDFGVCYGCQDDDEDGACADEDCDDGDPASFPGAEEICGDFVDQDCDDRTDEGCNPGCTDADEDGVCEDDDCDDGDPLRRPGADEICGDGVDQDCDDSADEGCPCPDADEDGACDADDCADDDPGRYPGNEEVCGDGIDQDCDGENDEGCPECEDADEDGVCAELDCADDDPERFPGAGERCGNEVDDDCDDATDEGCDACEDGDGDGFCAEDDCDDADAEVGGPGPNGCGCEDNDGDGTCAETDCDDSDPALGAPPCIVLVDAGMTPDGGTDNDAGDSDGDSDEDGGGSSQPIGCFCDAAPGGDEDPLPAIALLALLVALRRPRR